MKVHLDSERGVIARSDAGFAMVSMLVVVILLGVIVTIALSSINRSPTTNTSSPNAGATTTLPQNVVSGTRDAATASCEANFAAITAALADYRALNDASPPAGSAWVTSSTNSGPYLTSWPAPTKYYILAWNGSTLNVIPSKGVASRGSYGTKVPPTGCFAP